MGKEMITIDLGIMLCRFSRPIRRSMLRIPFAKFSNANELSRLLPKLPMRRLAFLMAALEIYKTSRMVAHVEEEAGNHILGLLKEFYRNNQTPAMVTEGIEFALLMLRHGDKYDRWAAIVALSAIPIPPESPVLLQIGNILQDNIRHEVHWPNAHAAAYTAIILKDVLPPAVRSEIKLAATAALPKYNYFAADKSMQFVQYNESAAIAAKLRQIVATF